MLDGYEVIYGDCLTVLPTLEAESVDAIVTDPPYGLTEPRSGGNGKGQAWAERSEEAKAARRGGFMGKAWDSALPPVEVWAEALRVAKPGAHLLAFGGTRTFHRLTCAIEDAGWEIRDCLMFLHGQGFPKSLDVSKAMDKAAGAERQVVGPMVRRGDKQAYPLHGMNGGNYIGNPNPTEIKSVTAAATDLAKQWDGWGTALKPAFEPIILARKPFIGTVAANVAAHGTGAINVDGCRVASGDDPRPYGTPRKSVGGLMNGTAEPREQYESHAAGRWPANVVLDEDAAALLDEQSGERPSGGGVKNPNGAYLSERTWNVSRTPGSDRVSEPSSGGASRFYLTVKPDRCVDADGFSTYIEPCEENLRHGGTSASQTDAGIASGVSSVAESSTSSLSPDGLGSGPTVPSPRATRSTTGTKTRQTTPSKTLPASPPHGMTSTTSESGRTTESLTASASGDASDVGNTSPLLSSHAAKPEPTTATASHASLKTSGSGGEPTANTTTPICAPIESGISSPRFFYTAKASRSEREAGLEGMPQRECLGGNASERCVKCDRQRVNVSGECRCESPEFTSAYTKKAANHHPTVKPLDLMRWLCRLITPPGGLVLDPFCGSGSTGCAAVLEGFRFLGMEQEAEYVAIAERRLAHAFELYEPSLFQETGT